VDPIPVFADEFLHGSILRLELLRDLLEAFIHNPAMKDFRNLKVWEKAHHLTLALYPVTASFPRDEAYGLASQIRRSASSIPSNIAEGCGREGDPEFARFCIIARGSASELEYQLLLARDLKLIQPGDYEKLSAQTVEIKRMLTVLVQKLTADA
jgi:four helix bundle protein